MMRAVDLYGEILGKSGGEGSRGGHIIGHTKSGKPIYGSGERHGATAFHSSTHGFSAQDHEDAAATHYKHANEGRRRSGSKHGPGASSLKAAYEHRELADLARQHANTPSSEHAELAQKHDKAGMKLLMQGAKHQSDNQGKAQELKEKASVHLDRARMHEHLSHSA